MGIVLGAVTSAGCLLAPLDAGAASDPVAITPVSNAKTSMMGTLIRHSKEYRAPVHIGRSRMLFNPHVHMWPSRFGLVGCM